MNNLIWDAEKAADLKSAMKEQAVNTIMELDSDVIEQIIVEEADVIADFFFKFDKLAVKCEPNQAEALLAEFGNNIASLIERHVDYKADEAVEEALG